jgi:hypothetical protein
MALLKKNEALSSAELGSRRFSLLALLDQDWRRRTNKITRHVYNIQLTIYNFHRPAQPRLHRADAVSERASELPSFSSSTLICSETKRSQQSTQKG